MHDTITVLRIEGGDGDGAELFFDFNGQRIAVSIFPSSSSQGHSVQDRVISLLGRILSSGVDDAEDDELMDEALEVILGPGRPVFRELSPPHMELNDAPRELHALLYPTTSYFQLIVDIHGRATVTPITPDEAYTVPPDMVGRDSFKDEELGIDTTLPCYSTRAILAVEIFTHGAEYNASRVLVDGTEMFCKALASEGELLGTSVGRELQCHHEIHTAEHDAAVRVPRLTGYVRHADTDRIVGFVRQWIPGWCLSDTEDVLAHPLQQRQEWMSQIRESVYALHARGIIWGDTKADSVVIDENNDAWLVDFGGGWTDGWVDEDLADAVEGDRQALSKIEEFLGLW